MRHLPILPAALLGTVVLSGCAGMTETQQRTMTGTVGGTAGGALIGAMAGNAGLGAVIGAGAGAAGGHLYDRSKQGGFRWSSQHRGGGWLRWLVDGVRTELCVRSVPRRAARG